MIKRKPLRRLMAFLMSFLCYLITKKNTIVKRAVEREFEIIGEAVNRISRIEEDFPIQNARNIVGLRNQVIHAYDAISDENIYVILVETPSKIKNRDLKLFGGK